MTGAERDALVLSHLDWARRLALATVRKHHLRLDRDDAIAAAHVALVEAAARYRPGGMPFDGFAFRRVAGAVMDLARREGDSWRTTAGGRNARHFRRAHVDVAELAERLTDSAPSPEALVMAAETWRLLVHATPRQREVLRRHYLGGESLLEVGRALGISESAACQLAQAGVMRIRAQ